MINTATTVSCSSIIRVQLSPHRFVFGVPLAFGGGVPDWGAIVLAHEGGAAVEVALLLLSAVVNAP